MSIRTYKLMTVYLGLLLALTWFGSFNQRLYNQQFDMIGQKEALQRKISDLRRSASEVNGPIAVRSWALQSGMVAATEVSDIQNTLPTPAPSFRQPVTGLEMTTLWR